MTIPGEPTDGPEQRPDHEAETANFSDPASPTPGSRPTQRFESQESPGDEVGPYRLISILGRGGFGIVWLAERSRPFQQRVALKVIRPGMDSEEILARFEQERQVLALLDHPNVARVFDGGMTSHGRPYFAMEYVSGEPISDFCDRLKLSIADRLRLFLQVCDAVQHAHTKGIIHRDLKPSNVLVSADEGGNPHATIIDFGIAKALTRSAVERQFFTRTGELIGTPEYISPEQAEPDATDIDTRADVYSLGAMLYELLTGMLPFEPSELRSKAFGEMQRIIREVDPPRPSTRLSMAAGIDAERATRIAAARQQRLDRLQAELRRELEWIPLKAMRKDRRERYGSSSDLAADIRNYLDGRPLVAAPESRGYRLRKFVRKHRGAVAAVVAVFAALAVGLLATLWQWRIATAALAEAEAMNSFVVDDVFGGSDVDRYDDGVRAVDLVRDAIDLAPARFPADPRLRARVYLAMGRALLGVGSPSEAIRPLESALADRDALGGRDQVVASIALAEAFYRATGGRDPERGAVLAREALATARSMSPVEPALESTALNHLGGALKGKGDLDAAESAYREALAIRERSLGKQGVEAHVVRGNLALLRLERARRMSRDPATAAGAAAAFAAVAAEFSELADTARRDLGERHAHAISMANEHATALLLASLACRASDPAAADDFAAKAVAAFEPLELIVRDRLAASHFRRVWIAGNHARALAELGRRADAVEVLRPLFESSVTQRVPMTADHAALSAALMTHLDRLDRLSEALAQAEASVAWARRSPDRDARLRVIEGAAEKLSNERGARGDAAGAAKWRYFASSLSPSTPPAAR